MISKINFSECCGCGSCAQRCPKHCIALKEDDEGFLYPKVDASVCIECGICVQVCPVEKKGDVRCPLKVYAAKNPNEEVRNDSSSGGIFSLLAERTIEDGGVVFGARFNEQWEVVHGYTETRDGLSAFRGSKYVQSRIGESYKQVEVFLKQGRRVLFCGTPCQVGGLRNFLRKDYENLLLVDFVCHGVPSPAVFRSYLKKLKAGFAREGEKFSFASFSKPLFSEGKGLKQKEEVEVEALSFRDKRLGWKKYSFALSLSKASAAGEKNTVSLSHCYSEDMYMQAFLSNMILRPSCYACECKGGRSGSDITLGDFWGIGDCNPNFDDDRGVSLLVAYSSKGIEVLEGLGMDKCKVDYQKAVSCNYVLEGSVPAPSCRAMFWKLYQYKNNLGLALKILLLQRVINKISF